LATAMVRQMKVYTRIVIDMATMDVLEEDSYEYHGRVLECKGDDGPTEIQETSAEIEASKIAEEQWRDYQARFVPAENKFIESVHLDEDDKHQVKGQVSASVARQEKNAQDTVARANLASGYSPGSGRAVAGASDISLKAAQAGSASQTRAGEAVTDKSLAGIQAVVNMGRGEASDANLGLGDVARQSVSRAISDAQADQADRLSRREEIGSGIGVAAGLAASSYSGGRNGKVSVGDWDNQEYASGQNGGW